MQRLFARSVSGRRLLVFVVLVVLVGCVVGDAGAGVGGGGARSAGARAAVPALLAANRGTLALGLVAPAEQLLCVSADRVGEVRSDRCGRAVVQVSKPRRE